MQIDMKCMLCCTNSFFLCFIIVIIWLQIPQNSENNIGQFFSNMSNSGHIRFAFYPFFVKKVFKAESRIMASVDACQRARRKYGEPRLDI